MIVLDNFMVLFLCMSFEMLSKMDLLERSFKMADGNGRVLNLTFDKLAPPN